jgi:thymidylate synthase ThyX
MTNLKNLHHIHHKTTSWINIYILDKWEVIDSEAEAMLQALHSRSTGWINAHLKILEEKWADNFMSKFYVWYGHKSIGDCGSITIFIEWLSMLGAKVIQDTKLYNWQEASTRYVDFSKQPILNPLWSDEWTEIQEHQRTFYLQLLPQLLEHLKNIYPKAEAQDEKMYINSLKAKAFDIARWFLPAWCSTNVARHTTLRQVADRITFLRHHPLKEIQEVAATLLEAVLEKYPNSFSAKTYEETEQYLAEVISSSYYFNAKNQKWFEIVKDAIDTAMLEDAKNIFDKRPNNKTELPYFLDSIGTITCRYLLDFGSFRDVQRHRAPYQRIPLLTTAYGFNAWYLNCLPPEILESTKKYLADLSKRIDELPLTNEQKQYYIPMGYNITCELMWTLPALVYLAELRSSTYVHPTLRIIALQLGKYIQETHAIKLFLDESQDFLDIRRWNHDIKAK